MLAYPEEIQACKHVCMHARGAQVYVLGTGKPSAKKGFECCGGICIYMIPVLTNPGVLVCLWVLSSCSCPTFSCLAGIAKNWTVLEPNSAKDAKDISAATATDAPVSSSTEVLVFVSSRTTAHFILTAPAAFHHSHTKKNLPSAGVLTILASLPAPHLPPLPL